MRPKEHILITTSRERKRAALSEPGLNAWRFEVFIGAIQFAKFR